MQNSGENRMTEHRHHHRLHRSRITRNLKISLFIILLALLAGKLALVISGIFTVPPLREMTEISPGKKKEIIDNYKGKYGTEWKKKLLEDYKRYTGK
jgi:hypothetical protein